MTILCADLLSALGWQEEMSSNRTRRSSSPGHLLVLGVLPSEPDPPAHRLQIQSLFIMTSEFNNFCLTHSQHPQRNTAVSHSPWVISPFTTLTYNILHWFIQAVHWIWNYEHKVGVFSYEMSLFPVSYGRLTSQAAAAICFITHFDSDHCFNWQYICCSLWNCGLFCCIHIHILVIFTPLWFLFRSHSSSPALGHKP